MIEGGDEGHLAHIQREVDVPTPPWPPLEELEGGLLVVRSF